MLRCVIFFQGHLKKIMKNAIMPYDVYSRFLKIQLLEVNERVEYHRGTFTGELATTSLFYRTFHFPDPPQGSYLLRITVQQLDSMIQHSDSWMVIKGYFWRFCLNF